MNLTEQIEALKIKRDNVKGTETEKYARIVGYYRAVKNWNIGKKEEWKARVSYNKLKFDTKKHGNVDYSEKPSDINVPSSWGNKVHKYIFFYRTTCPNCPPVKAIMYKLRLAGKAINVDSNDGFIKAQQFDVMTAPTVVFLDKDGGEIYRTSIIKDLKTFIEDKELS
jgi:ribonucleoside-triphosphate reductase